MQGVNLPAQNVILRNPHLAIRKRNGVKPKLTDYEIANLRGRAGRLLKDFIGRTFVLEENSFEKAPNQEELFAESEKKLKAGYGDKYLEFKPQIDLALSNNQMVSSENSDYSFIMTHIRQTVLRHGSNSAARLKAVGIELSEDKINTVRDSMNQLTVSTSVCSKNRYWDPLDLEKLYNMKGRFALPTSVADHNIEGSLEANLRLMARNFEAYYKKYFDVVPSLLQSASISAKDWMKERPLKEILSGSYFDDAEKIESKISQLQRNISYGLPMLMKPLYDILAPDNMFLRFIEVGAYHPVTRKMIELNLPRETAIELKSRFFNDFPSGSEGIEDAILKRLKEIIPELDYWRRVQVERIT